MIRLKFEKPAKKAINFGWAHGRYADLWSLVHINTGILLAISVYIFKLPLKESSVVVILLLVLYEMFELTTDTIEDIQNSVTDIIVAFASFFVAYFICSSYKISHTAILQIAGAILILTILLDYIGWKKYLKKKLETNKPKAHKYIYLSRTKLTIIISATSIIAFVIFII